MATLVIQLLGDFRLTYGEAPVTGVNSPRLQALLAYLLLHRDAPQSRQHRAFLLYPDCSEAQAGTNLRIRIHRLRQAVPAADLSLQGDAQTMQWQTNAPFTLDVAEFENAVAQASSAKALVHAVNLYYGDLLLFHEEEKQ